MGNGNSDRSSTRRRRDDRNGHRSLLSRLGGRTRLISFASLGRLSSLRRLGRHHRRPGLGSGGGRVGGRGGGLLGGFRGLDSRGLHGRRLFGGRRRVVR